MSTDTITIPGTIPGLLRRGSPVVHPEYGTGTVVQRPGGLSVSGDRDGMLRYVEGYRGNVGPDGFFALDLTDATGRAHAAWWLRGGSSALGMDRPEFRATGDGVGFWFGHRVWHTERPWLRSGSHTYIATPTLAGLDPADSRTLPDGSRWVDAEALRRVIAHVAGLTS